MISGWLASTSQAIPREPVAFPLPEPFRFRYKGGAEQFVNVEFLKRDAILVAVGDFRVDTLAGFGSFGFSVTITQHTVYGAGLVDNLFIQTGLILNQESCPDTTVVLSVDECPTATIVLSEE